MEPLAKRQRLTYTQRSQRQEEDELNFEPEEVDKQRDPGQQLEESRAFAAYKLKSTFEHIFQKYERDFTGIGDEIDLRTGEIVVNNGHIQRLGEEGEDGYEDEDEGMLLEDAFPDSDDEDDEEEQLGYSRKQLQYGAQRVNEDEEDRILQGRQPPPADPPSSPLRAMTTSVLQRGNGLGLSTPGRLANDHRLSSLALSRHAPARSSPLAFGAWGPDQGAVDPIWRTPQMPSPRFSDTLTSKLYGARYSVPAAENHQSIWSLAPSDMSWPSSPYRPASSPSHRRHNGPLKSTLADSRKLLLGPGDEEDEDEILSGGVTRMEVPKSKVLKALPAPPTSREAEVSVGRGKGPKSFQGQSGNQSHQRQKNTGSIRAIRPTGRPLSKTAVPGARIGSRAKLPTKLKSTAVGDVRSEETSAGSRLGRANPQAATSGVKKRRRRTKATNSPGPAQYSESFDDHPETIFVLEDELPRGSSIHRLVIELARRPEPAGLTNFVHILPESPPRNETSIHYMPPPVEGNKSASGADSGALVIPDSQELSSISSSAPVAEQAIDENSQPHAPKESAEKFTRNEIDPSYDFSDDESGIPVTRLPTAKTSAAMKAASDKVEMSGPTKRVSPRQTAAASALSPTLLQEQAAQQHLDPSEVPSVETNEKSFAQVGVDRTNAQALQELVSTGLPASESSEMVDRPEDLLGTPSDTDMTGPAETTAHHQWPELAAYDFSIDMEADFAVDDLDENFNQISEQTDPFMPSKRLLDPCDDRRQPESPNGPEDEDLPQERAVIEVQDSDGSDGLSDLGCPEALETILETLDMPPVVLPTSSEPVPEDIPSSPPLSHTTRTLKRKTELAPEAQTSITEVEQAVATIPPSTPATQKEAAVVEITSSEEPLPTTNTKSKTRKKDNPSTPRTQRETPHKPSSRRSILSLRPEDADEDEISLVLDSWSGSNRTDHAHLPLRTVGFSSVRRNTLAKLAGSSPLRGRSVMSSAGVTASGGGMRFRTAREGFGGMSTPTKRKREVPGSPAGSLIQTPGGRLRRCGVDGFSCDRDFCFTCLGG